MKRLRISDELSLPAEAVTETFGLLAVRGAGKTNAARVMAEEMFDAGLPFVAVDPVGSWRGLRAARDGKGKGIPIPIFGGKWGDVPLERGGGELLADLVVDQRLSCVLDLSTFESEASKKVFLLDFARRLYLRNEAPLHLFLEEADDYIPQRPQRDEAQLLRAWENIVRRGRARGIGCTLITQRSASVAKDVLTQVQTLIAMRTTGPQDLAAIALWLKYHAAGDDIVGELASLKSGEAWVWSPVFLAKTVRIRFRLSHTFDSGATPKHDAVGASSKAAATLADVDLGDIQKRMAATIERAKAADPRELQKRVRALELELAEAQKRVSRKVEVAVVKPGDLVRLDRLYDRMAGNTEALVRVLERMDLQRDRLAQAQQAMLAELGTFRHRLDAATQPPAGGVGAGRPATAGVATRPAPVLPARTPRPPGGNGHADRALPKGERAILVAIAQHVTVTREQLSVLTGYKRSARDTYLQRLRAGGLVLFEGDAILATDEGVHALGRFEALPIGDALREHWLGRLPKGERAVLEVVCEGAGQRVTRESIDAATGYKRSARDTYLQRLGARRLVVSDRDGVRASEQLFG